MKRLAKSSKRKISEFIDDFRVGDVQKYCTRKIYRGRHQRSSKENILQVDCGIGVEVNNSVEEDRKD